MKEKDEGKEKRREKKRGGKRTSFTVTLILLCEKLQQQTCQLGTKETSGAESHDARRVRNEDNKVLPR